MQCLQIDRKTNEIFVGISDLASKEVESKMNKNTKSFKNYLIRDFF